MDRLRQQLLEVTGDEPVTLEDMMAQLRLDDDAEAELVTMQVAAAREYAETLQDRALIAARYVGWLDRVPRGEVEIPRAGDVTVESVVLLDHDGEETAVPSGAYLVDSTTEPARLVPRDGWPSVQLRERGGVRVLYSVTPRPVPQRTRAAIKLIAADFFEHREATLTGSTVAEPSLAARKLLGMDRLWRAG